MLQRVKSHDRGSVSVFIIGCFVLALLLVATATDLAVLQLDRRTLQAEADSAALAAAQAPDLASIYKRGLTTYVPIDPTLARRRALTLLHSHAPAVSGLTVATLTTDGRTVYIRLTGRVSPPFLRLFGTTVSIDARARATTAVG